MNYSLHMSSGHIMGFEIVACDLMESSLMGFDEARHDDAGRHIANAHKEELNERYFHARNFGRKPQKEGYEVEKHTQHHDDANGDDDGNVRSCHGDYWLRVEK